MSLDDIPSLQAEIDALDADLVELLRQRLALSRRIGRIKQAHAAAPFDQGRIASRHQRFLGVCQSAGLPPAMAEKLFTLIADQVAFERREIFGTAP